jgi:spore germination protein GerM
MTATAPTRRRPRRRPAAAAVLLLGASVAACGIPADDDPRAISPDNVPPEAETEAPAEDGATEVAAIWFTRSDGSRELLTRTEQEVAASGAAPSPASVLEALFEGPPNEDVGTSIPTRTALGPGGAELTQGLLTVDLNDAINDVLGERASLAYGQMVCSVDELPGVEGVRFSFEGRTRPSPRGDGVTTETPLTCEAYDNLRG